MTAASLAAACAYYDFAVRYGDLLFDARGIDVTRTEVGGVNQELEIAAPVAVSTDCAPACSGPRDPLAAGAISA